MDITEMKPLDQIKQCLERGQNFVLQGGAGSGKTETLKQSLGFIAEKFPDKKIACITHTNLAVDEIASRIEGDYCISTIHSFLNELIKDYKKNIHQIIYDIFKLDTVTRMDLKDFGDEEELKKAEHENYKKLHKNFSKKLFALQRDSVKKIVVKKEYYKAPDKYNTELNDKINKLNLAIQEKITNKDYLKRGFYFYNETKFDSLKDLTFGHDSLLAVTSLLFSRYPLISRIIQDKFDYIFIDEYQDTNPDIVDIFLNKLPHDSKTVVGLFGDSMQGIYDNGIGDVNSYVESGKLRKILKPDNFRCSESVVSFLNSQRVPVDKLKQEVALKAIAGNSETLNDRQGYTKVYYSIYPNNRPHARSPNDEKNDYLSALMQLISQVELENEDFKKLMLTNKAIAKKLNFSKLFGVFNDRYTEVNNEIEACLEQLQLLPLAKLCIDFEEGEYNSVISKLKKSGFTINTVADKKSITEQFDLLLKEDIGAIDAVTKAMSSRILPYSESCDEYIKAKEKFCDEISIDIDYISFKEKYQNGGSTFVKFDKKYPVFFGEDEEYTGREARYLSCERRVKKERFYEQLYSKKLMFREVINYCNYLNEKSDFITMHKTKGSGIDNVLVVLDDFFWTKYSFKTLFEKNYSNAKMKLKIQKIFYVACSRAKNNLVCVRLITADEKDLFLSYFGKEVAVKKF